MAEDKLAMLKPNTGMLALDMLRKYQSSYAQLLPSHLKPERAFRIAEAAVKKTPALLACNGASLMRSVIEASVLGLEVGVLGECYLIPYGKECTLQVGFRGMIKLATQSKAVLSINVGAVRTGDFFEWELGSHPYVKHRPSLDNDPESKPIAVYCVVRLPNGGFQATVMSAKDVDRIRAGSKAKGSGPWVDHYEAMAIKTVIKRALKYVPQSPQLARAVEADSQAEIGGDTKGLYPEIPDVLPGEEQAEEKQDTASKVADALGVKKGSKPEEVKKDGDEWGLDKEDSK